MDDSYYNKRISLLLFPNRTGEKIANFFSVKEHYLWRRDSHRLVAFKMAQSSKEEWNYPTDKLTALQDIVNIEMSEKGILNFFTKNASNHLYPVSESFFSHSFQTMKEKNHHVIFEILSKDLSKQLSIFQRKILNSSLDMEKVTLTIHLKSKTIELNELSFQKEVPIKQSKGESLSISYSFAYFRDLLINCNKFNEWIVFKVHLPYFTKIDFDANTCAILTHKKDSF